LGFTPNAFDTVYLFVDGSYTPYTADYNPGYLHWSSAQPPAVNVAQGFLYATANPNGLTWVRNFNIN